MMAGRGGVRPTAVDFCGSKEVRPRGGGRCGCRASKDETLLLYGDRFYKMSPRRGQLTMTRWEGDAAVGGRLGGAYSLCRPFRAVAIDVAVILLPVTMRLLLFPGLVVHLIGQIHQRQAGGWPN